MNYIFIFLILISLISAIFLNRVEETIDAMLSSSKAAVEVAFGLIGIMAFWLGIMRIAEKSGLVKILAKLINPITKRLFNELPEDNPAVGNIALSFSANALGLTNAATPIGLRVMEELQVQNKDKKSASNSMCLFLAMNTAGFQIIPATVIAILVAVGSKNPTEIILPTMIVTSTAFISAIIVAKILQKLWTPQINNTDNESEAVND